VLAASDGFGCPASRDDKRVDHALRAFAAIYDLVVDAGSTVNACGVPPERIHIVLDRTAERGLLPATHIEHAINRSIEFQVPSDYRSVAMAVNGGVALSSVRPTEFHAQISAMARALIGWGQVALSA
jgi:hypothetical protein